MKKWQGLLLILFVFSISSDGNHYGKDFNNSPFGLLTAEKLIRRAENKGLSGKLFRYSDTYSEGVLPLKKMGMGTTAPFSLRHWVSFFAIGYYLD
jgi:hypothetical protein